MPATKSAFVPCQVVRTELEIEMAAPRDRVWNALLTETAAWWPKDFLCVEGSRGIQLEAWAGGRMFEDDGKGSGILWYQVIQVTAGQAITLSGAIAPPFGGPATTLVRVELEEAGEGRTRLKMTDCVFGQVDEKLRGSLEDGWTQIFDGGLRVYAENAG